MLVTGALTLVSNFATFCMSEAGGVQLCPASLTSETHAGCFGKWHGVDRIDRPALSYVHVPILSLAGIA